jgi:hypothetical protein
LAVSRIEPQNPPFRAQFLNRELGFLRVQPAAVLAQDRGRRGFCRCSNGCAFITIVSFRTSTKYFEIPCRLA